MSTHLHSLYQVLLHIHPHASMRPMPKLAVGHLLRKIRHVSENREGRVSEPSDNVFWAGSAWRPAGGARPAGETVAE